MNSQIDVTGKAKRPLFADPITIVFIVECITFDCGVSLSK